GQPGFRGRRWQRHLYGHGCQYRHRGRGEHNRDRHSPSVDDFHLLHRQPGHVQRRSHPHGGPRNDSRQRERDIYDFDHRSGRAPHDDEQRDGIDDDDGGQSVQQHGNHHHDRHAVISSAPSPSFAAPSGGRLVLVHHG